MPRVPTTNVTAPRKGGVKTAAAIGPRALLRGLWDDSVKQAVARRLGECVEVVSGGATVEQRVIGPDALGQYVQ